MVEPTRFTAVEFYHFKAFKEFKLNVRHFNILVGPNNAGKSTVLTAFRILAAALKKAQFRKPEKIRGPAGRSSGYPVDLDSISVAEENIFYNYDDDEAAHVTFRLSNRNALQLYFPEQGSCYLIAIPKDGQVIRSPSEFKTEFNCSVGFVPILGPVEHNEHLYTIEAARSALSSFRAARNFRNIWHHYPEKFEEFQETLRRTWPGMDVDRPVVERSFEKPLLRMFCPEGRIPREIFWAGFGFQVWCQMLTYLIQAGRSSIFLVDEPDIYLHSDLQRQLVGILRDLGPDVIIATHSTEMITEAEPDDIVLVDKKLSVAKRIKHPSQLVEVFSTLGSNLNPVLTQLAKTRRAVFVEGGDFQIIGKIATKLGQQRVGNRSDFAVISAEGFNPERVRSIKSGMELTLGSKIATAAIFDRDYRGDEEVTAIKKSCGAFCDFITIHDRKELENFLLVPSVIDRAAARRLADRANRTGQVAKYTSSAAQLLEAFASDKRSDVMSQYTTSKKYFDRAGGSGQHEATITKHAFEEFEKRWQVDKIRMAMIPGKEALAALNQHFQENYQITVTPTAIIEAMQPHEIMDDAQQLIEGIAAFSRMKLG